MFLCSSEYCLVCQLYFQAASNKVFLLSANNFAAIPEKIWIKLNSTVHYPYHHTI